MSKFASSAFNPPEIWNFKPFFTIQPNAETKEKQMRAWKDLILQYCQLNKIYQIQPATFPYFRNEEIDRSLTSEGRNTVVSYLVKVGNAEWEDNGRSQLRILWKSIQTLANEIYEWANKQEMIGTVYTIYELHSGDEFSHTSFYGTDVILLRRALQHLERSNKCVIIAGSIAEEDGVKFLAL